MRIAEKEMVENNGTAGCNERAVEGAVNRAPRGKMRPESAKKEEAGQVVLPPLVPFRGCPASLTEGGWPVVCWPTYIIPAERKKFR
jgi:hypothetical protein